MSGIFDRMGALVGGEWAEASAQAQRHFQQRMGEHHHVGRAFVETVAEFCLEHNNLVGVAAGIAVERTLQWAKDRHDAAHPDIHPPMVPAPGWTIVPHEGEAPPPPAKPRPVPKELRLDRLNPLKVALEVFGALLLLKLAAAGARFFRRKARDEVWFAPAGRIRLFSGALSAYFLIAALKSPRLSAWRNGAILFFGTDAIKPLVRPPRRRRLAKPAARPGSA